MSKSRDKSPVRKPKPEGTHMVMYNRYGATWAVSKCMVCAQVNHNQRGWTSSMYTAFPEMCYSCQSRTLRENYYENQMLPGVDYTNCDPHDYPDTLLN